MTSPLGRLPKALAVTAATAIVLGGCVFYPLTTMEYDPECNAIQKHMSLTSTQVEAFIGCHDRGCVELLALAGVISATSFVISGSIAVVGDVVYWLEARQQCRKSRDENGD